MRQTIIALAMVLTASVANAQEEFDTEGVGVKTCGEFALQYRSSPTDTELFYFNWAQGYMSGLNAMRTSRKVLNSISFREKLTRVRSYCSNHPFAQYFEAVTDLYNSMPTFH